MDVWDLVAMDGRSGMTARPSNVRKLSMAAVIVAAGSSKRMGRLGDKIWIPIAGRPVLFYSIAAFLKAGIRQIVVAARPDRVDFVRRRIRKFPASSGAKISVVPGGKERQDSVWNALCAVESAAGLGRSAIVLVHDAARPAVTSALIRSVFRAAVRHGASVPALPVADTLKRISGGRVRQTENRVGLFAVQTPQAFRRDWLLCAIASARRRRFIATDCAALVERLGKKVAAVPGDPANLKLTRPTDLLLLKHILRLNRRH